MECRCSWIEATYSPHPHVAGGLSLAPTELYINLEWQCFVYIEESRVPPPGHRLSSRIIELSTRPTQPTKELRATATIKLDTKSCEVNVLPPVVLITPVFLNNTHIHTQH